MPKTERTHKMKTEIENTKSAAGADSSPSSGSPFVFLDERSLPCLAFRGWLHYWHPDKKWVTLRDMNPGERETLEARKLPDDQAAFYGWPCMANAKHEVQS